MTRLLNQCTFHRTLATLVFLVIILACGLTPMQGDTWWQLRAGRDMWASGRVMLSDVYSHTSYGSFWVNHEWLAEVFYYLMFRIGGLPLVTLAATALIAGGWAMTWQLVTRNGRAVSFVILTALVPASMWWEPRPHAFSLLFLPATVLMVARGRLLWLPPIFLIWANCHGGVLLGLVIVATGLAARTYVEPRTWRLSTLTFVGCLLAVNLTPLGPAFWVEIPKSLGRIHLYPYDEWRRPGVLDPHLLPFWVIAIAFCVGLYRQHRAICHSAHNAAIYACAFVLLPMAVMAIRNVGPFLLIAIPALTALFPDRGTPAPALPERRLLNLGVMTSAALAVIVMLAWGYHNRIPRLRWSPISPAALAALQQCPDNLYNRYDEGGQLLWFAPDRKVFLDGRQDPFPTELVLEHLRMENDGADYRATFSRHNIRCAYLPISSPTAVALATAGWKTLYRGSHWTVLKQYDQSSRRLEHGQHEQEPTRTHANARIDPPSLKRN